MPHKRRSHGHHKHPKEADEQKEVPAAQLGVDRSSKSTNNYPTAGSYYGKSQPSQATPKPAAQVSTVKPAQFEKASSGSTMATKPGVITTATGGATRSGVTAGGSASVGTAGKAKPETNTTPAGATVIDMSSAGSTFVDMTSAGARSGPKEMSKTTAAVSQVKAAATAPSHAAGAVAVAAAGIAASIAVIKPKESPKGAAQSTTATTTVKADVHKVDPAKTFKPVASAVAGNVQATKGAKPTQTKVQVEVPPAAATGAKEVDPFDALASILPSVDPVAPIQPVYTGPEVIEPGITFERPPKCGGRDSTLPPGYRFEDMPPAPADYKPKDVPKPLSTDEALDSLSFGFTSSTVPAAPKKQEKKDSVECVSVSSADLCNFAPLPVMKTPAVPPVAVCPPADKKPKMEKVSDDFSLEAGLTSSTATNVKSSMAVCPPADKKTPAGKDATDGKLKTGQADPLDAFSALSDTLPKDAPKPELPKLRPEDIVSEDEHKKEKGVFVGERESSINPKYRFNEEELKKLPAPKPEPTIDTGEALDFLSEGFSSSSSAPAVQALPAKKTPAVPLEAGLTSSTATNVKSSMAVCPPARPAGKKTTAGKDATDGKLKTGQDDPMSLDALGALGGLLPKDAPKPELPELRPEDIVSEDEHKKEKGVLVGERESSINPKYRFNEEELKKLPAPKPEPTVDTGEALDFLSEGFSSSSSAPALQAPISSCIPPAQTKVEDLSALDLLSSDFVTPAKSAPPPTKMTPEQPSSVKVSAGKPQQAKPTTDKGTVDSMSLDALSALCDTLPEDVPKAELPELRPEDIVTEDKHTKKKGVLVGERDDSIPPEYRFKEEELKKLPAPKPEPTVGTGEALDFLSEGFTCSSSAPAVQAPVITPSAPPAQPSADLSLDPLAADFVACSAAPTVKSSACPPTQAAPELSGGADSALDALSDTLADIAPAPQPAPPPAKDIVNEKKAVEERLIKMGERDDSLPPEYRPTEEDLKKMAEEKAKAAAAPKKKTMDDKTALDLLSSDFTATAKPTAAAASCAATTKLEPPVLDSEPLKPMSGPVLDSLSSTLLPDAPEFKSKTDKPKGKSKSKSRSKKHHAEEPPATDQLSAQFSSDVVPKSTKKGGKS
ncbi:calpastatin isoform X28 [Sebastes umbrosus]|uniref:calpastatin isoform X28 n=1 Tax=Sebastes umbrosus TaxID=72105 RepID=UPI0018A11FEA|nr:calpastatin isoform X28 [Sebastes umbrosus]